MIRLLTVVLLLVAFQAGAQQQDSAQLATPTRVLQEMTVSALRWEQNIRDIPMNIAKIPMSQIQFQNPQTAADLLGATGQVFIQKSQLGGGSPMLRGFATNRVMLVMDGIRLNNAIFRSGNVQNVISLDAHNIADAEVIFGPGAVMYGSDAIGGVMDFHTLRPTFNQDGLKVSGRATARYASANQENTTHIDLNIGTRRLAFVSAITYSDYDDLVMGSHGPDRYLRPDYVVRENNQDVVVANSNTRRQVFSGYSQLNVMQKVAFQATPHVLLQYAFHHSQTSNYARYDRLILKNNNGQFTNGEWYYGPQRWQLHSLQLTSRKPTALYDDMKITAGYQHYQESRHNRSFNNNRRTNRWEEVQALSLNADFSKQFSDRLQLFYGAEGIYNKVNSTANRNQIITGDITPVSTRYPDNATWQSYAAYLSLKLQLDPRWILHFSNRFSYVESNAAFDTTFFQFPFLSASLQHRALNGSIGVVFAPTPSWKIYGNLSSGFRAPNIDDVGKVFDSQPGAVVVPNPQLQPEQAYQVEVGASANLSKTIDLHTAFYYTTIDNAIARGVSTFNGQDSIDYDGTRSQVLALQNIGRLYVYGLQAGVTWKMLKGLALTSTINYQRGEEKDIASGNYFSPTSVAPTFGATHLTYTHPRFKASVYAVYQGQISYARLALSERADQHLYALDTNGNPYAPRWTTLNMKSSVCLHRHITVDVGIENIGDKRYRSYSSGISAPGRNIIVALRATL